MKKRHRLLAALAALAIFAIVLHPAVHWRLYGWARGEPFWDGRPASYWRHELATWTITASALDPVGRPWQFDCCALEIGRPAPDTLVGRAWDWLDGATGYAFSAWRASLLIVSGQPDALPVLKTLLDDPDPSIRGYAASGLGGIGVNCPGTAAEVVPALRRALGDRVALPQPAWAASHPHPPVTVADLAAQSLRWIETGKP